MECNDIAVVTAILILAHTPTTAACCMCTSRLSMGSSARSRSCHTSRYGIASHASSDCLAMSSYIIFIQYIYIYIYIYNSKLNPRTSHIHIICIYDVRGINVLCMVICKDRARDSGGYRHPEHARTCMQATVPSGAMRLAWWRLDRLLWLAVLGKELLHCAAVRDNLAACEPQCLDGGE